jgi:hypothetical protein
MVVSNSSTTIDGKVAGCSEEDSAAASRTTGFATLLAVEAEVAELAGAVAAVVLLLYQNIPFVWAWPVRGTATLAFFLSGEPGQAGPENSAVNDLRLGRPRSKAASLFSAVFGNS